MTSMSTHRSCDSQTAQNLHGHPKHNSIHSEYMHSVYHDQLIYSSSIVFFLFLSNRILLGILILAAAQAQAPEARTRPDILKMRFTGNLQSNSHKDSGVPPRAGNLNAVFTSVAFVVVRPTAPQPASTCKSQNMYGCSWPTLPAYAIHLNKLELLHDTA